MKNLLLLLALFTLSYSAHIEKPDIIINETSGFTDSIYIKSNSTDVDFYPTGSLRPILKNINEAKINIKIASFILDNKEIISALYNAKQRGVDIEILTDDKLNNDEDKIISTLKEHNIPVRLVKSLEFEKLNAKFIIIDGKSTIVGNFKKSFSTVYNDAENIIIFYDGQIIEKYENKFKELWEEYKS